MKFPKGSYRGMLLAAGLLAACSTRHMNVNSTVDSRLEADPLVKGQGIEVESSGGLVVLKGNVDSEEVKERALSIARHTEGVTEVKDMIAVRTGEHSGDAPDTGRLLDTRAKDAGISTRVKARLTANDVVKARHIDVDTREGVVYLTGTVDSAYERDVAIRVARDTEGVRDVQANLEVVGG